MSDLTHLFVPYELAVKLKEKGFKETCFGLYDDIKVLHTNKKYVFVEDELNIIAPLYQQVVDWLREKHNILFSYGYSPNYNEKFACSLNFIESENYKLGSVYTGETYYEAQNKAIEEAIKLI